MPQTQPLFYQSPDARKTVILIMIGLLSITVASYGVLFFQITRTQLTDVNMFVEDVTIALNHEIAEQEDGFSEALNTPRFNQYDYELIVFSPTGKTSVLSHHTHATTPNSPEKISLPNGQLAQENQNTLITTRQGYEVWQRLEDGYSLYGEIKSPAMLPYFLHPLYLLPFGVAVLVFLILLSYFSQYYKVWREMIGYSQNLQQTATQTYQPLQLSYQNDSIELAQMKQALNRTGFQLHQYVKKIHYLTSRQQLLVDNAPVALFLLTRTGQITYFNPSFAQIFKTPYQADAVYHLTDFITGEDKTAQQIISNLTDFNYTQTLSVTDLPRTQYFDLRLSPTYNEFGQLRGYSGSLEIVDSYYTQLQQAWLNDKQQQEKLAQFTKLWAVLGHEMRTPLSGIIGMIALLNEDKASLSADQQELLHSLTESSDNMLQLLNDMLDMAKLDAGKLQTNLGNTDLLKLCQSVCGVMGGTARRQNIELLYHTDPLIPRYLMTDEGRLRQILLNLINNAIKFTSQGYVALLVDVVDNHDPIIQEKAFTNQTAQTWLKITIKDTGIGISEPDQKKLFAYFNQANDSISQQFGGTGIGLALSKNFTQMLGGFIHLHSVLGEGSEFQVYLPLDHYQPQTVFTYNTQPYDIALVFFTAHAISQPYIIAITKEMGVPTQVMVSIDENVVAQVNNRPISSLMTVFVVDDKCYEKNPALFEQITDFRTSPKILFSMQSQQHIPASVMNRFDGFITKPIFVSNFMAELSRLIMQKNLASNSLSQLTAQQAFEKFLQKPTTSLSQQITTGLTNPTDTAILSPTAGEPFGKTTGQITFQDFSQRVADKPTILLAEDNVVNQKIAQRQLEKMGYSVLIAENGQQAITLLQENREKIALILMDCNMPIMDGFEATRRIRATHDSIPIVALTANEVDNDSQRYMEAGMDNVLTKPLNKQALQDILTRYMI